MFNWLRRRRLSEDARKKLLLVAARSQEAVLQTHVENLVDLLDTLGDEVELDRGLELYAEIMSLDEEQASRVTNRLLVSLEKGGGRRARTVFRPRRGR